MSQEEMLEELRRIRNSLEPKPKTPAAEPVKKGLGEEFIEFLNNYGVVGLAIGFIFGKKAIKYINKHGKTTIKWRFRVHCKRIEK
ncbi:MAG: hypothetical protein NWE89_01720 [Candidatus Bathyarchaeota archaeon]|nr:hypothetical protein [Candidatus Bathyarchaeota archaeon]